jgi:ankyrin repeat protein
MTAPLDKKYRSAKEKRPVLGFIQTVKSNYRLERILMKWTDVHERDELGHTALYWAIYHNNMYNIRVLLDFGCTLDVSTSLKAPFWAIDCGHLDIVQYFLDKGIDLDIEHEGKTLLEYAKSVKSETIINYLRKLESGISVIK